MPFVGEHNGEVVWPDDVDGGTTVACPECGDEMHVRSGYSTETGVLKPRCFVHNPDASVGGLCRGGESDTHKLMKYVVSRRLRRMFDHGTVQREQQIPGTDRIGDVVVTFDEPFDKFGHGVVAEVQYRHDDKDIKGVTKAYLQAGYSVYWLNESHFTDGFEVVTFPDLLTPWPNAVPATQAWSGVESSVEDLDSFGKQHPLEVKFPPDFVADQRELIKKWWSLGSGMYDYGVVYQLSEYNAERSCDTCSSPASVYLFQDGVISTFRCDDHLPGKTDPEDLHVGYGDDPSVATDGGHLVTKACRGCGYSEAHCECEDGDRNG